MTRYTSISVSKELLAELNELRGKKSHTEFISDLIHTDRKVDQIVQNKIKLDGIIKYLVEISRFLDRSSNGQFQSLTPEDFQTHRLKAEKDTTAPGY